MHFERILNNDAEKAYEDEKIERNLVNINDHEDFPIERARMLLQHLWIGVFSAAAIGYGWVIQSKANIAVPLILQFIRKL